MKVKDMKFEEFKFNPNRRLVTMGRHYDNGKTYCFMQLDLNMVQMNNLSFDVRLRILDEQDKPFENQSASFTLEGVQLPYQLYHVVPDLPGYKNQIDKKYIPWILSAIELFREVNQDIIPSD